jgi:hypothetical protein
VLSYRVILDVPLPLVVFVSGCWRLTAARSAPGRDACPDLLEAGGLRAGVVPGPAGHPPAGPGFGISQATAYRYKDEAVEVLAAKAPRCARPWTRPPGRGFPT